MSIDPNNLSDKQINADVKPPEVDEKENYDERFGLPPGVRVTMMAGLAGTLGAMGGFAHGYRTSSLKYLASNSHRLPTSYNGWYYYHKRKVYYCMKEAMGLGFGTGSKLAGFVGTIFGLEALLDTVRGQKDFANTTMAVVIPGAFFVWWNNMPKIQANDFIRKGGRIGLGFGLLEDTIQWMRGVDVWYLSKLGIKPKKLTDRIREATGEPTPAETKP